MKLLFDQNISFRIAKSIQSTFPNSIQVRQAGMENASDKQIWDFAKNNSYSLVTFDSDFSSFATLYGHPPKIVWLRTGNINTEELIKFLEAHSDIITEFLVSPAYAEIACLELARNTQL